MDLEKTAMERLRMASEMSLRLYKQPLVITYSGGKDSDVLLHLAGRSGIPYEVLPCKVGERWTDEEGRAVRITAVIVSIDPFGTSINIYFDYEDATPDDAGSDCVTNWNYFSRHYTCIEADRAMEG